MKRLLGILGAGILLALLGIAPASAQQVNIYCQTSAGPPQQWAPCNAGNPLQITGSFSATTTGFPGTTQTTGTPISVTTGGVTGTLPTGAVVVASNVGATNGAYCKLGASATTSDQLIPPNSWFGFTVGSNTQLTCITSASTTTVNMVGGAGLPTGSGGGGGGGGGLSVIDAASWTTAVSAFTPTGGVFNDSATALSSGQQGTARLNANREMHVTCDTGNVLCAAIQSPVPVTVNGVTTGVTGLNPTVAQTGTVIAINTDQTSIGGKAAFADPCKTATKIPTPITQATSTLLFAGTASKKNYVCSILSVGADAENMSLVEGTGPLCAGSTAALIGGTTAATGLNFTAGNGFSHGVGDSFVAGGNNNNFNVCLLQSGTGRVAGSATIAQQTIWWGSIALRLLSWLGF